jgi:hypothetical protein
VVSEVDGAAVVWGGGAAVVFGAATDVVVLEVGDATWTTRDFFVPPDSAATMTTTTITAAVRINQRRWYSGGFGRLWLGADPDRGCWFGWSSGGYHLPSDACHQPGPCDVSLTARPPRSRSSMWSYHSDLID